MEKANQIVAEVKKAVVGKDIIIKKVLMVMLAKGHVLLEDIPGVGKTTLAMAFAKTLSLDTKRMQFTPDIMPSDVVGYSVLDKDSGSLRLMKGAAFCNLFLADEINRTSSKTQSALLEVMEEGRISVDGTTFDVPKPFTVIATQNPLGSAGTLPLPESQMDRFMMRLSMGYPTVEDEIEMLKRKNAQNLMDTIQPIANAQDMIAMQADAERIYLSDEIFAYIMKLVDTTRHHNEILQGASPRAALSLCAMAKACAYLSNRDYVAPQDIQAVFVDTIAHRLRLRSEEHFHMAKANVCTEILSSVPAPRMQR